MTISRTNAEDVEVMFCVSCGIWLSRWLYARLAQILASVRFSAAMICSGVPSATMRAAAVAAFRTQVDHPIRALDHFQIVLDDQHAAAVLDQPLEGIQQLGDIVEVQAGGGLVEDVQSVPSQVACARCAASLTRCASPPESVVADWPRRR